MNLIKTKNKYFKHININDYMHDIQEESKTSWREMYQVFNMGHRMELYIPESIASDIISISNSFNVDAKIIGRVEPFEGKKLTIQSKFGEFNY